MFFFLSERLDFFPLRRASFTITGTEVRCFFIYNYRDNLIEPQEEFTVKVYTLVTDQFAVDFRTTRVILEDDDSKSCSLNTCYLIPHMFCSMK